MAIKFANKKKIKFTQIGKGGGGYKQQNKNKNYFKVYLVLRSVTPLSSYTNRFETHFNPSPNYFTFIH